MRLRRLSHAFLTRIVCLLVLLTPPIVLAFWGAVTLLARADDLLTRAAPIASHELTRYLGRPVRIGGISPSLSLRGLWAMVRNPETYGKLPVMLSDISVGNRRGEAALAASPLLATARRVTLFVSLPQVLSANFSQAVARILVEGGDLVVVRDRNGHLNLANILPPHPPTAKPSPPFLTVVDVSDARVRFRDYAARFPAAQLPAVNAAVLRAAVVNVGARALRFSGEARAQPGTMTAARLGGGVSVAGSASRGQPSDLPNSPSRATPHYLISLRANDADAPYWYYYFQAQQKSFRVEAGRVDAALTLTAPQTPPGVRVEPDIVLDARFRHGRITTPFIKVSVEDAAGNLRYTDGAVQIAGGSARVFGERVGVTGAVWGLQAPTGSTRVTPHLAVTLDMSRLPIDRVLSTALPSTVHLPAGLRVGGNAAIRGTVVGGLTGSLGDLSVVGSVAGLDASYPGYPAAHRLAARLSLAGGLLRVIDLTGQLGDRGRVAGQTTVRLLGSAAERGNAVFDFRVEDVDISSLSALRGLSQNPDARLRLAGRGDLAVAGRHVGGKLTAAANIVARQFRIGEIPFPVARARVLVDQNRVVVPAARLESPMGIARVDGDVAPGGGLSLRFAVTSLDLLAIGQAFGLNGLGGMISASGSVSGSVRDPRVTVSNLLGLNLRFRHPVADGTTRNFALDLLASDGFDLTRQRLTLTRPLVLRRFPAVAVITGEVKDLIPTATGQRFDPKFNLIASLNNLDFAEIERQLSSTTPAAVDRSVPQDSRTGAELALGSDALPWNRGRVVLRQGNPTVIPPAKDLPPIAGSITNVLVRATGALSAPHVTGRAELGNLLLGAYPAEGGAVAFDYNRERTLLSEVRLDATVGTATASGVIRANGEISGQFHSSTLDVKRLSFLTNGVVTLGGEATIAGTVSGTVRKPVVLADATAPTFTLSGTTYKDVEARHIQYVGGAGGSGVIKVPTFAFQQGETRFHVLNAQYDVKRGDVAADVTLKGGDLTVLLDTIRRSGLRDTNAAIADALAKLPEPMAARFDVNRLSVRGRIANGRFEDPRIAGELEAHDLRVGTFTANTLSITGSLKGRLITIDELVATRPDATIRGQGTYDPDGDVNAYLDSNNISLDIVRSIRGQEGFPVRGTVELTIAAAGKSKSPNITATVSGRDLLVLTGGNATVVAPSPTPGGAPASPAAAGEAGAPPQGITLALVRAGASIEQDKQGLYHLYVRDFLVSHRDAQIRGEADLPFTFDPGDRTVDSRPISIQLNVPKVDLGALADLPQLRAAVVVPPNPDALTRPERYAATTKKGKEAIEQAASSDIGGSLEARVGIVGTLSKPELSGGLALRDGHFRLARAPGSDRDRINPISDLTVSLSLGGIDRDRVMFDQFRLTLGGPNGQRGDFGTLDLAGNIRVSALDYLRRKLSRGQPESETPEPGRQARGARTPSLLGGTYDLTATLKDFRVQEENLFDGNEVMRTKANGQLLISGPLMAPQITTAAGQPVRLSDSELRPPSLAEKTDKPTPAPQIRPYFGTPNGEPLRLQITDRATVTNVSFYRFDAQGDAQVSGPLFKVAEDEKDPNKEILAGLGLSVLAKLNTLGGFVQFPTVRFKVQKNGIVSLYYGTVNPGVFVTDVVATGKITTARGTSLAAYDRSGSTFSSYTPDASLTETPSQTYNITMTLNGPLDLLNNPEEQRGSATPVNTGTFTLQSDPALSQPQILALVLGQSQVDLARQGEVSQALRGFASQAILSSYVPGLLAPITGSIASSLGLEDVAVDYNPDAPLRVRAVKRLPDPLDRFTIGVSRTFQTSQQPTQPFPYEFNLSYEVYQFKAKSGILPRIQAGINTDEQHTVTYFLRGSVTY